MELYKITIGQKNAIVKPQKFNGMFFNPIEDINGEWFISEVEKQFCDENFGWSLTLSEFVSPPRNVNIRG